MPAAKKPEPVTKGPQWLRKAFAQIIAYIDANKVKNSATVTVEGQYPDGVTLKAAGGGADGDLETITGAVNGVPSTLEVMTDGAGWTTIP